MIDPIGVGLGAVAARSAFAYPLVFAAGILTSAGPCAAPRYITAAALASAPRSWPVLAAFGAGIAGAYVVLGAAAGTLSALYSGSRVLYAVLAIALGVGGAIALLRAGTAHRHHDVPPARSPRASLGGAFLLGSASAFVVSPCCTPVVAAIGGLTMAGGRSAEGAALLGAFGCGHALPVLAAGAIGTQLSARVRALGASGASAVVTGGLMFALAAYYGTLA